jgi:glycosyltransferase involved in cell wall biosynthesis
MMVVETLVSVVVPVYNGERYLGKTLESALAQTYQPLEIVVVDDGSTDGTPDVIAAIAARDSRLRFFRKQKGGVAAARNFGIGQARGTLIAMLDADDLWHPEKVARQVAVMNASPANVGLVYCWAIDIDENGAVIPLANEIGTKQSYKGRVTAELATGNFVETSSIPLIKRPCIEAVGGYDVDLQPQGAEDWKLYLALSEICEFAVVPQYLVGYRQYGASLSRDVSGMAGSQEGVVRWLTEKWPDLPKDLGCKRAYEIDYYLAAKALSNHQFLKSLHYRTKAYRVRPSKLPERSDFEFLARFLFRLIGLRRSMFRSPTSLVPFEQFLAAQEIKKEA